VLDPHRRPALFAVATSVLSGLILVPATAASGRLLNPDILGDDVRLPVLFGLVLALAAAPVAAVHRRRHHPDEVFLIMSATTDKHWLVELLWNLERSLDRFDLTLVVKIPDRDYDGTEQVRCLERTLARKNRYVGGFVIPAEPDVTHGDFSRLCRAVPFPVVFLDIEPFAGETDYPANAAFVGYDDEQIGEMAAHCASDRLGRAGTGNPAVLVVGASTHVGRHNRFVSALADLVPRARIDVDTGGQFTRDRARAIVRQRLGQADREGRHIDVIFCTSDEMAFGALDALREPGVQPRATAATVIGVDGTREARALIRSDDSAMRATVAQDPRRVAGRAVDVLMRKRRGLEASPRQTLTADLHLVD
jgi:ribose transport system substrate-binding protein